MKLWEKFALGIVAVLAVVVGTLVVVHRRTAPSPDVIQQAAQSAASAIVTTEHATASLQEHALDSAVVAALRKQLVTDSVRERKLLAQLSHQEQALPVAPAQADTAGWRRLDDSLTGALDTANTIIVAFQHSDSVQRAASQVLLADNAQLAGQLLATRDTLATHRLVVIPASAVSAHTSWLSKIRLGQILRLNVGYGTVYSKGAFTFGPAADVGVSIPLP